jgi:hypothetical protein
LTCSGRVNGAGYSANIFYLIHLFDRDEIQIAFAERDAVFARVGKFAATCHLSVEAAYASTIAPKTSEQMQQIARCIDMLAIQNSSEKRL